MSVTTVDERIERLSSVSLRRVVEPDEAVPGEVGPGQILPDELLSVAGLELELTSEQRAVLSREEVAAICDAGVRFEAVLAAGFGMEILRSPDLTDPRVTYILHELGEETRHSRLFIRLLAQLEPKARNPIRRWLPRHLEQLALPWLMTMPALFVVLVLTGEEVPDLLQKLASEHPDTDPFVRAVNRYHRQEEARHLAFGRMLLPELWERAGRVERWAVRRVAPLVVSGMFDTMIHPGVYRVVGLPGWRTWRSVNRSSARRELKHAALAPLVEALSAAGVFRGRRVSRGWRRVAGV